MSFTARTPYVVSPTGSDAPQLSSVDISYIAYILSDVVSRYADRTHPCRRCTQSVPLYYVDACLGDISPSLYIESISTRIRVKAELPPYVAVNFDAKTIEVTEYYMILYSGVPVATLWVNKLAECIDDRLIVNVSVDVVEIFDVTLRNEFCNKHHNSRACISQNSQQPQSSTA